MTSFFRTHRLFGFLLVHALISVAVCVYFFYLHGPVQPPFFEPYAIAFAQTFLGSFAGALLSLIQLVIGAFKGFTGMGELILLARPLPLPFISGIAIVVALLLLWLGVSMYSSRWAYLVFVLCSVLFLCSSVVYFSDSTNNGKAMLGHPALLLPAR